MAVPAALERRVRQRANGICEYCRLPESAYALPFEVDHIVAEQHEGKTRLNNICLACPRCNRSKGPNVASIESGTLVPLFNPRRDRWEDHFAWRGPRVRALTPVGRVTIRVLAMNHPLVIRMRGELIAEGRFP
jgi:hypothetical protein